MDQARSTRIVMFCAVVQWKSDIMVTIYESRYRNDWQGLKINIGTQPTRK